MKERISKAAELILPGVRLIIIIMTITITTILRLDMLGYGCTSASAVLGEEVVFSQLASRESKARFTTPATAATAAFRALGSRKVGLVTPYVGEDFIMGLFGKSKGSDPKEQVNEWCKKLRKEERGLERQA